MLQKTFYALVAESEKLSFFCCSVEEEFIVNYAFILEKLYQLKQDAKQECFYAALEGSGEEIIDLFRRTINPKENKLLRSATLLHQLQEIFEGKTEAPLVYVDGEEADIKQHLELVQKLIFGLQSTITDIE